MSLHLYKRVFLSVHWYVSPSVCRSIGHALERNIQYLHPIEKKSEKNNGPRRNVRGFCWCVKSCGSHFNLYYVILGPLLAHMPNLIQIGQKTQKLEIFTFGQFWLVGLVGRKKVEGISNSFYVVFAPLLAPIPNFIQIGWKTRKLKIFTFGQFWLVGLVGRKLVATTSNIRHLIRGLPMTSVPSLNSII